MNVRFRNLTLNVREKILLFKYNTNVYYQSSWGGWSPNQVNTFDIDNTAHYYFQSAIVNDRLRFRAPKYNLGSTPNERAIYRASSEESTSFGVTAWVEKWRCRKI